MDLLDNLDIRRKPAKTYTKVVIDDTQEVAAQDDVIPPFPGFDGLGQSSLLDKIRKRLDGDDEPTVELATEVADEDIVPGVDETQMVTVDETQIIGNITGDLRGKSIFNMATQVVGGMTETQVVAATIADSVVDATVADATVADATVADTTVADTQLSTQIIPDAQNPRMDSLGFYESDEELLVEPNTIAPSNVPKYIPVDPPTAEQQKRKEKYSKAALLAAFASSDEEVAEEEEDKSGESDFDVVDMLNDAKKQEQELQEQHVMEKLATLTKQDDTQGDWVELSDSSDMEVTKEERLLVKTKYLKRAPQKKAKKTDRADMIEALKKANREQLIERQKELMEGRGIDLEEIEKEEKAVENLLEQEIARNRRIREQEKRRERQEEEESGIIEEVMESDYSAAELESGDDDDENEADSEELESGSEADDEEEHVVHEEQQAVHEDSSQVPVFSHGTSLSNKAKEVFGISESQIFDASAASFDPKSQNIMDKLRQDAAGMDFGLDTPVTQPDTQVDDEDDDDDDDIVVNRRMKKQEVDEEEEEKQRVEAISAELKRQKRKDALEEKRRKDMKLKGVNKMVEAEAEESEDEWKGLGGADGEQSDEYDSDLEKMVDDFSKVNFDKDEIRKILAAENMKYDEAMINKLLADIKNGTLRKRGRNQEIELSDEEDEDLIEYHKRKRERMRQKLLENNEYAKLLASKKTKAFFDSITEDFDQPAKPLYSDDEGDDDKNVVTAEFVQRQLSFLTSSSYYDEEFRTKKFGSDDEDMSSLQAKCSVQSSRPTNTFLSNEIEDDFDEEIFGHRMPSVVKNFAVVDDDKFKDGVKPVKISKSFTVSSRSKASITYMSNMRKLKAGPTSSQTTTTKKKMFKGVKPIFNAKKSFD